MKSCSIRISIALCTTLLIGTVFAKTPTAERDEVPAVKRGLTSAEISLSQAIASAEAAVPGRAISAQLSVKKNVAAYKVEILRGDSLLDIKVDSRSGQVISSTADPVDHVADECDD